MPQPMPKKSKLGHYRNFHCLTHAFGFAGFHHYVQAGVAACCIFLRGQPASGGGDNRCGCNEAMSYVVHHNAEALQGSHAE
jgi:hypothetical protein